MNNQEKIENLVKEIMKIEKKSMQKKFNSSGGKDERLSIIKADTDVVNDIMSLLGEGKKGDKR